MCSLKKWMLASIECVFLDFWDARGLGLLFMVCACAVGVRGNRLTGMRGTWGSRLAVCACAYDPIHVTAQGQRLGPICACVQLPGSILHKTMSRMWIQLLCACVLYSMGSRVKPCPYMGICDVNKSHGPNARF